MSNVSADEGKKLYSPAIELYEEVKSSTIQFYNNLIGDEQLNLGFQSMEQPLTKGFDFVCYNSCKERNDDGFLQETMFATVTNSHNTTKILHTRLKIKILLR